MGVQRAKAGNQPGLTTRAPGGQARNKDFNLQAGGTAGGF